MVGFVKIAPPSDEACTREERGRPGVGCGAVYGVGWMAVVRSEGACLLESEAHDTHEEPYAIVLVVVERAARRVGVALGGGRREARRRSVRVVERRADEVGAVALEARPAAHFKCARHGCVLVLGDGVPRLAPDRLGSEREDRAERDRFGRVRGDGAVAAWGGRWGVRRIAQNCARIAPELRSPAQRQAARAAARAAVVDDRHAL